MTRTTLVLALALLLWPASAPAQQQQPAPAGPPPEFFRLNAEAVRLFSEGKLEEALASAQSALAAGEKAYGASDPRLLMALHNLAAVQRARGKKAESEGALRRALSIYEQSPQEQHALAAEVLDALGLHRYEAKDFGAAEDYWSRAADVAGKIAGPESAAVGKPVFRLAELHRVRSGAKKAAPLYERAFRLWLKSPQENKQNIEQLLDSYYCTLVNSNIGFGEVDEKINALVAQWNEADPLTTPVAQRFGMRGGAVGARAVVKPAPEYPLAARQRKLTGAVALKIVIDEQGSVVEAKPMCAHPILMESARAAVMRARFLPATYNGVPVKVTGLVTYRFVIQ